MGLATSPHVFQQDSIGAATKTLNDGDLNNTGRKLLLSDVGSKRDTTLDFLTSVPSIYSPSIISSNRLTSSLDDEDMEIRGGTFNNLGFQIVETGTINIVSNDFDLDILEIDTIVVDRAEEVILLFPSASYLVTDPDQLDFIATDQSATFSSKVPVNIDNLNNLSNLSSSQEDLVVSLGRSSGDRDFDSNISVVGDRNESIKGLLNREKMKY